jgi:hypothetical protein
MTGSTLQMASNYVQWFGSLCIFLFALNRSTNKRIEIKIVGAYGLISFLFQLIQTISRYGYSILPQNAIGNIYVGFEALIILLLFYSILKQKFQRLIIIILTSSFLILYVKVIGAEFLQLSPSIRSSRDVILVFCSLMYFYHLLKELPSTNIFDIPMFWINSSILFFFSCTFILSLFADYIAHEMKDKFYLFWSFRNFSRAIFCMLICIGVWKANTKQRIGSQQHKMT